MKTYVYVGGVKVVGAPRRAQVSFGVHKSEAEAARQYDRALIIVKGRLAKTNFPVADYDAEVAAYLAELLARRGVLPWACYTTPFHRHWPKDKTHYSC